MKIKEAADKANEALEGAAAQVERAKLTKWVLLALGIVLLIAVGLWFSKARATGFHPPIIVTPPVVAPPVVVATPVVVPPPSTAAATPLPAEQPSGGGSGFNPGYFVMAGVAIFFYAVICQKEREVNSTGWFARNCKPDWMK